MQESEKIALKTARIYIEMEIAVVLFSKPEGTIVLISSR
jgi:hypothetical protein